MTSPAHARVGPSALHRIKLCSASLALQELFPNLPWEDEEASAEGTCAHWILAAVLTGAPWPKVGDLDADKTAVTQEMLDGVELAVDAVDELLEEHGCTRADLVVEKPVAIKRLHESCWGTPDIRFWSRKFRLRVIVIDFKFGFRFVNEIENDQLVAYTVGEIDEKGHHDLDVTCVNTIIQPRAYAASPVRSWTYKAIEVRGQVTLLVSAIEDALSGNPRAVATVDGCRDCRARHACSTLQLASQDAMAYAGQPVALELEPIALSTELRFAERMQGLLEARMTGLQAQAKYLIENGGRLPHHVLKPQRSTTRWDVKDEEAIAIGSTFGINLAKPPKAITPSQALKAGMHPAVMKGLATTWPGANKLAVDDGSTAARVFGRSNHATQ